MPNEGKVYIVGGGPGDPGLLTLRGAECLARADVVIYDYLVNAEILEHAPPTAERICLGRHGHGRILSQDEVHELLVRHASAGRIVVRLKGGDPAVFARSAEEIETLVAAGIPLEIVPGVTAALAAGSYAGIPITHRELASGVALVTGQESPDKQFAGLDFESLARFPGTLVFYMGVTSAPDWCRALVAAGKPDTTPAAVVRRCSWPDQQIIECTLADVPSALSSMRPPVIVILGDVVRLGQAYSWFPKRPLFGQTVLVTRPLDQAREMRGALRELGAEVLVQPAISISDPPDWTPVDTAIASLSKYQWIVFSSANGVEKFMGRLLAKGFDLRQLGGVQIAAIGPATSEALAKFHLRADAQPEEYRAESLAEALQTDAAGKRFLLVRASRGREVLAERLLAAGGSVDQVVAYSSTDVAEVDPEIAARLCGGKISWVTVTSSAIAASLVRLFGDDLRQTRLASISPLTSSTLRELGHESTVEADDYTTAGVIAAIVRHEQA